jgi:hypothetical protein
LSTRTRPGRPYSRMQSSKTQITRALGIDVSISIARASRLPPSRTLKVRKFRPS